VKTGKLCAWRVALGLALLTKTVCAHIGPSVHTWKHMAGMCNPHGASVARCGGLIGAPLIACRGLMWPDVALVCQIAWAGRARPTRGIVEQPQESKAIPREYRLTSDLIVAHKQHIGPHRPYRLPCALPCPMALGLCGPWERVTHQRLRLSRGPCRGPRGPDVP
jgi:hypothetical protein